MILKLPTHSIVVPVFRSEAILPQLHERIKKVMEDAHINFEIVFVDDCGGDDAWKVIQEISRLDARVRGFSLTRNFGQHNALLAGIRAARGGTIITLDDDLQNPPEEIPTLLAALTDDVDVVYGKPLVQQHGLLRNLASKITKITLQHSMGAATAENVSAFRAFRTVLRDGFSRYQGPYVSIDVLLTWSTARFSVVTVKHHPRLEGESGYTLKKLINHAVNMMTGFSTLPLQLASMIGFALTLFGFVILFYVLIRYFYSASSVAGFSFLASIIAIFSGAQLFSIGIIGEYLARMHFRSMEKPAYLIRQTTNEISS